MDSEESPPEDPSEPESGPEDEAQSDLEVIAVKLLEVEGGVCPFEQWLNSLRDKTTRARILARLARVRRGNLGDAKSVGSIFELRFKIGPGYRIYFARKGDFLVILLGGGDKKTQSRDIERAQGLWEEYRDAPERSERRFPE